MQRFGGLVAVVTGGGTGMGRELVRQLAREGCHVATCDVDADALHETVAAATAAAPVGTRVVGHLADVADEPQVLAFRDAVEEGLGTEVVHLLFNNAGIAGGGSLVTDPRE